MTELKEQKDKDQQMWFDQDQGRFFKVDDKGASKQCTSAGQDPPKYKVNLTGVASFNQRYEHALRSSLDGRDSSLESSLELRHLKESPSTYMPQLGKFEGYAQFRCPVEKKGLLSSMQVQSLPSIRESKDGIPQHLLLNKYNSTLRASHFTNYL
jgi:hypothetical protein